MRIFLLGLMVLVSACATEISNPSGLCLGTINYSKESNEQALAELDKLGPNSILEKYMDNYAALRAKARAACAAGKK